MTWHQIRSFSHRRRILGGAYADKVLSYGPIAYWPLDEASSPEPDFLTFNGTSTHVTPGSPASLGDLPNGEEFTVEAWINPTTFGENSQGRILHKTGNAAVSDGWSLQLNSSVGVQAVLACATTSAFSFTGAGMLGSGDLGDWHHITMYYNDAGDRKIYLAVNGTWHVTGQTAGVGAYLSDAARALYFGYIVNFAFNGKIGWVRISDNDRHTAGVDFTPPSRTTVPTVDANTVGLWPLNEGYGSVAGDLSANGNDGTIVNGSWGSYPDARCLVNSAQNGTYSGVTLNNTLGPDGKAGAPFFDGVNDFVNIYSAALDAAFNGATGSLLIWAKVANVGVWTDATTRDAFYLYDDSSNYHVARYTGASAALAWCKAGAGNAQIQFTPYTSLEWFPHAITWSDANNDDEVKLFIEGIQRGATNTGLNAWSGLGLDSAKTAIGANGTAAGNVFHGWLADAALFDYVLPPAAMLDLATR